MATENLRLGVDPRPGVRGMKQFSAATEGAIGKAWSMNAVLGTMAASFGVLAAGRAIGSGIKGMMAFDQAMTQSLAIQGQVSESMRGEMADAARRVGEELNFAATEGAEAFFFLASAGLDAEQQLAALPAVAQFARAGMFDFATATDLATDAQSALGLASQDAQENLRGMTRVTDVLVKANTLANATVEQFASALTTEAGAALKSFNIDMEEGVAVLAAFADQGVKGQTAGSGLSRILRLMGSAAVNNREEMAALGIEILDSEGNMRNLADVVESLEGALGGMSDAQRIAALESIGFQARVQGVLLPLLGTSEAIREYEAGLRQAGGTTRDVAGNQMESLENRVGAIRQQFTNWRDELAGRTIPAIEWAIVNVDTLTGGVQALATAVGVLIGLKFAAWGIAAASGVIATAQAIRTASALSVNWGLTLAGLARWIGPQGLLLAGTAALTYTIHQSRAALREHADELERQQGVLKATADEFRGLGDEALRVYLIQMDQALMGARERLGELEEAHRKAGAAGRGMGASATQVSGELKEQQRVVAELEAMIGQAATAYTDMGRAGREASDVDPPRPPEPPDTAAYEMTVRLIADALDLDLERVGLLREALDLHERLVSVAKDETKPLADRVDAMRDARTIGRAVIEQQGRMASASIELAGATELWRDGMMEIPDAARQVQVALVDIGSDAEDSARTFEHEWLAAIQVVGGAVGGLAGQLANIATLFATGNVAGGVAAGLGAVLGGFGGGDGPQVGVSPLIEEARRAADELARFADGLRDVERFQGMRQDADDLFAQITNAASEGAEEAARQWAAMPKMVRDSIGSFEDFLKLFDLPDATQAAIDYALAIAAIEEAQAKAAASMTQSEQVRALVLAGRDEEAELMRIEEDNRQRLAEAMALNDEALIALVEANNAAAIAAHEAAQAERELAEARAAIIRDMDLAAAQADLWGTDLEGFIAAQEVAREKQRQWTAEMLEAGKITQQQADEWNAVHDGRFERALDNYTRSLQEAEQAAREAAEAEAFRQSQDLRNLEVQVLRAQGRDMEALQLQQMIQLEAAMRDQRSAQYIQTLQMLHAEQLRNEAMKDSARAATDATRALTGMTSAINAPAALTTSLNRWLTRSSGTGFDAGLGGAFGVESPQFTPQQPAAPQQFQQQTPAPSAGGGTSIRIDRLIVQANTEEGGRAALRGVVKEARDLNRATGVNVFVDLNPEIV